MGLVKERVAAHVIWPEIVQACETSDPSAIRDMTGLSRGSLVLWRDEPKTRLTRKKVAEVRAALAKIKGGEVAAQPATAAAAPSSTPPTVEQLAADVLEVKDLLRSLLALGKEGRADETIRAWLGQPAPEEGQEKPPGQSRQRKARSS